MSERVAHSAGAIDQDSVVCCLVGDEQFALHSRDVRLVARAELMRAEDGRNHRVGTVRYRDEMLPVYRLAGLIGRAPRGVAPDSHVVVTESESSRFGLLVDRAVRSRHAGKTECLRLPSIVGAVARQWFEGILRVGDVYCLWLSPSGLVGGGTAAAEEKIGPGPRASVRAAGSQALDMVVIFASAALPGGSSCRYALPAGRVAAVVQALPSLQLPGAPAFIKELAYWQGAAVPMVDFNRTPGRSTVTCNRHLLVRTRDGGLIGFPADADVTLHHVDAGDALLSDATLSSPVVAGVFAAGNGKVALLDLDALIAREQQTPLALCAS